MGSFELEEEEERLLELVNDFIESSSTTLTKPNTTTTTTTCSSSFSPTHFGHSTHYFIQENLRKKSEAERKISEKVGKHMRNKMDVEKTIELKKWLVKCLKMDGFLASICHTSWVTTPGCPCGNYEYIEIVEENVKEKSHRIIVDINFKSQFEVARPTKSYIELSSKLPNIYVGREDKLKTIISLLCSAIEESLRERGLHIPPWRKLTYINNKYWKNLSNNFPNYHHKTPTNLTNICPNNNNNNNKSRFGKWVPPLVMIKGWRRDLGGDSSLSNQFSNMGINCC